MRILSYLVAFFFIFTSAYAQVWRFNPNHSQVRFEVPFMGVSMVEGTIQKFRLETQELEIDDSRASLKSSELVLLVSGLSTGVAQRDRHLKGPDFFYSSLYPRFVAKTKALALNLGEKKSTSALVTLKDVTREVPVEVKFLGVRTNKNNQRSAFFEISAKISRKAFGLGWNQFLAQNEMLLGDEISVFGRFEFNPSGERPAISEFYKLNKAEREKFAREKPDSDADFEGPSSKEVLILEAKVKTLTTEVEALSESNEILRQEVKLARGEIGEEAKRAPSFIVWASSSVFVITLLFGFSIGVWIKWKLLAPLKMENPKYVRLDRLTDLMLILLLISGVTVMSWFLGLF